MSDGLDLSDTSSGGLIIDAEAHDFLRIDCPEWDGGWRLHMNPPGPVRRWILARFGISFRQRTFDQRYPKL